MTVDGDTETLAFIFIQTAEMKENVKNFGKVLMLARTYKINRNKMPVAVFMVMDGSGAGRSAGYACAVNKQLTTVTGVLDAFKSSVPEEVSSNFKTVIIGKDSSEIAAIQTDLPNA